jgi:hypothetical protein
MLGRLQRPLGKGKAACRAGGWEGEKGKSSPTPPQLELRGTECSRLPENWRITNPGPSLAFSLSPTLLSRVGRREQL